MNLDYSFEGLKHVPQDILANQEIKQLDLSDNDISVIPDFIGFLENLEVLDLSRNNINRLPESLCNLRKLRILKLGENNLKSLPTKISDLVSLEQILINDNRIKQLPFTGKRINSLEYVNISGNLLASSDIGDFLSENIRHLNLSGNRIESIDESLSLLEGIKFLNISNNSISELPSFLFNFVNLEGLYLSDNAIGVIDPEVANLTKIKYLDYSNNLISEIPDRMLELVDLQKIKLQKNLFENIPDELFYQPPSFLINYLNDLKNRIDVRKINEAKLIIVGDGGVGKSSIVSALKGERFNKAGEITRGIEIKYYYKKIKKNEIRVNIWDFGGQEILHSTHQIFMTNRSAYLVVIDPRIEDINGERSLNYWLELISSHAPDAPIIISSNKSDQYSSSIAVGELSDNFPNIVGFVETSCLTGDGISKLDKLISKGIKLLPHYKKEMPVEYFKVKSILEENNSNFMNYQEYCGICSTVNEKMNGNSQRSLLNLLHDLGIVFNLKIKSELDSTQVLNPNWITEGIYKIIASTKIIEKKGVLSFSDIRSLLDSYKFPTDNQVNYIIEVMKEFGLTYHLANHTISETLYFVPSAFPIESPLDFEFNFENSVNFQYHYNVLPQSIMSKLMVRLHEFISPGKFWRKGFVLDHTLEKNLVLIKSNTSLRKISVYVTGNGSKRSTIAFIRAEMDFLNKSFPNLEIKHMLQIGDVKDDILINYDELLIYEEAGEKNIFVPELRTKLNVRRLLDGADGKAVSTVALYDKIGNDRLSEVFEDLFLMHPTDRSLLLLKSNFLSIQKDKMNGLSETQEYRVEYSQLVDRVIKFIDQLEKK